MRCGTCTHENPSVARFCQECGAKLLLACSSCDTELSPQAKFCHGCGQQTQAEASPMPETMDTAPGTFAESRYQMRQLIGEGAKKRVHLAYDSRLSREVALALIKTDGLDEAGRVRVRREAQAMGSLGDHPNIVTVHDIGEEGDQLYIVSQYMSGGDLEQLMVNSAEERKLSSNQALSVALELCRALDHAHSRGVIHRDVKPGNVWLAADGSAKLGDFGLAVSLDRSRITQEGMMVGTVAYMAPEQALGRPPDARSDLYAIGATLYEMLTGRPPFLGDDAVSIISQHINTPPVAPSWHNPEISQRLEALILELLEKDPERRPASARVLVERLEALRSAPIERERSAPQVGNPLDRLASGVFVGREDQLEHLRHGLDEALSGHGGVMLLVGEPGIGKTRTSEELATYARMRGAQVLWGRCHEGEGAPAYWPWMQIIRDYVHEREPQSLLSEMGLGAANIAEVVSEVRECLPGLPTPPVLDPEQARFRLHDSITSFLKNASLGEPLMLVLDDLHWSDRPTLLLLQFLAQDVTGARVLVLGTYRDVEVGRRHPLEQTLAELARTQTGERVLLRGLSTQDVSRFIELSCGRAPPRVLVEAVYRETEGNPFFVHEVVRLLQSDGRLDNPDLVESWSVEIPQGVRQVVGRRLNSLSEDCNRVLTVASIIGREFSLHILARASELNENQLLELLEEAEDARILAETDTRPGHFRFSHALVRETLYEEVRTTRRVRLHRQIAEVLETIYKDQIEVHLPELAYHYCESALTGNVQKAVEYAERAAWRAHNQLAFEESAEHFERALGALEAHEHVAPLRRCQLMLSRAGALVRAGLPDEAERVFFECVGLARGLDEPEYLAIAAIGVTPAVVSPGTFGEGSVELLEEVLQRLGDDHDALRIRVAARLAGRYRWSDLDRAREYTRLAYELRNNVDELTAYMDLIEIRHIPLAEDISNDTVDAANEFLQLAERKNDLTARLFALNLRFFNSLDRGGRDQAELDLASMEPLVGNLRQPEFQRDMAQRKATLAILDGRIADARREAWTMRQEGLRFDPESAATNFGLVTYMIRRLQGRLAETEETLKVGAARYEAATAWLMLLAVMYAETGRGDDALELLESHLNDDFRELQHGTILSSGFHFCLIGDVAIVLNHREMAQTIYDRLSSLSGIYIRLTSNYLGSADRTLGAMAGILGRHDEAESHFEAAIDLDMRLGALGWLPRTQCDYARMLLARSAPDDRAKALALLDEAMQTSQRLGLKGWLDECIQVKLAAQGLDSGSVSSTTTIDAMVHSIGSRPPDLSLHGASDGMVTLMFSDMEDFTRMTERLGDYQAREIIREHNRIVREQVQAHDGHEVELQGDGFLLAFHAPEQAVRCAVALQQRLRDRNKVSQEHIRIRIGIHTGEALRDADKFFGLTVILAARIAAQAKACEILVSADTEGMVQADPGLRFGASHSVKLKGIAKPQHLIEIDWESM